MSPRIWLPLVWVGFIFTLSVHAGQGDGNLHERAIAAVEQGDCYQAARHYTRLLFSAPDNYEYRIERAGCYVLTGKLEAARKDLQALLRLGYEETEMHLLLANILMRQQEWEEARTHLETVLKQDANNAAANLRLGEVLRRLGDMDGAEAAFRIYRRTEIEQP